jgi:hypothetical protein
MESRGNIVLLGLGVDDKRNITFYSCEKIIYSLLLTVSMKSTPKYGGSFQNV